MAVNKDKMLALWYPFTKDWTNQGVDNSAQLSSSNATIVSGGKLGKCLQITGTGTSKTFTKLQNLTKFSIALWIRNDATSGYADYADVFSIDVESSNSYKSNMTTQLRIERNNASDPNTYTMYFLRHQNGVNANNAATYSNMSYALSTALNTWTHVVMVCDGTKCYAYVNGVLKTTLTISSYATLYRLKGPVYIGNGGNPKSSINDFRIYTYALSDQEIKELSKGKVCHYPLDEAYGTSLRNKYEGIEAEGKSSNNPDKTTITKLANERGYNYKVNFTSITTGNQYYAITWPTFSFTAGKTYQWSCDVRVNSCSAKYQLIMRPSRVNNDWTTSNQQVVVASSKVGKGWIHYNSAIVVPTNFTREGSTITSNPLMQFYNNGGQTTEPAGTSWSADFDIRNIQVVESDIEIPFIYNEACGYMYDISGNHYDLTPTGNISLSNDTKRYKYSCNCIANTSSYLTSPNIGISTTNTTLSFWYKRTAASSGQKNLFSAGGQLIIWFRDGQWSPRVRAYKSGDTNTYLGETAFADASTANTNWCHCAAVINGKSLRLYYNGTPLAEQTTTSDISNTLTTFQLAVAKILISDFRIYATALSEADIKELYALGN